MNHEYTIWCAIFRHKKEQKGAGILMCRTCRERQEKYVMPPCS